MRCLGQTIMYFSMKQPRMTVLFRLLSIQINFIWLPLLSWKHFFFYRDTANDQSPWCLSTLPWWCHVLHSTSCFVKIHYSFPNSSNNKTTENSISCLSPYTWAEVSPALFICFEDQEETAWVKWLLTKHVGNKWMNQWSLYWVNISILKSKLPLHQSVSQ